MTKNYTDIGVLANEFNICSKYLKANFTFILPFGNLNYNIKGIVISMSTYIILHLNNRKN